MTAHLCGFHNGPKGGGKVGACIGVSYRKNIDFIDVVLVVEDFLGPHQETLEKLLPVYLIDSFLFQD